MHLFNIIKDKLERFKDKTFYFAKMENQVSVHNKW